MDVLRFLWLLPIASGVADGIAWTVPKFTRLPAFALMGAGFLCAVPFEIAWLLYDSIPTAVTEEFWPAIWKNLILLVIAFVMAARGVQISPLILVQPIRALTPAFVLLSAPFLYYVFHMNVGDMPSTLGIGGVLLMAGAIYLLNLSRGAGLFEPIRAILRERGVLMMFGVALLFSVTSLYDFVAMKASSGPFYLVVIHGLVGLSCLIIALFHSVLQPSVYRGIWSAKNVLLCMIFGFFFALAVIAHMLAFEWILTVSYVVGFKSSLSAFVGGIAGLFLLSIGVKAPGLSKEAKNLGYRLPALVLLVTGLLVVVIKG